MLPVLPAALLLFYLFACSGGPAETPAMDDPVAAENPTVYYKVDQAAMPEAGIEVLRKYIARNIRYPEQAQKKGIEGKVYIRFIIDENGRIVSAVESREIPPPPAPPDPGTAIDELPPPPETADISGVVVVSYRPPEGSDRDYPEEDVQSLVDEAIRVISECDLSFRPAMKDGKPVKSAWTIPIAFFLQ
jgi:hypothetical protein